MTVVMRLPGYLGIGLVWLYRVTLGALFPTSCKYHPSCSEYAVQALRRHGLVRGGADGRLAAAALQPVEPRRLRPGPVSHLALILASTPILGRSRT